jgi:hypothetical protein
MGYKIDKGYIWFVFHDKEYIKYYRKSNSNVYWRCTVKFYHARVETVNGTVVKELGVHIHLDTVANPIAVASGVECKCQASEDMSQRPSKLICSTLQLNIAGDMVTSNVIVNRRTAIYRQRRKQ